MNSRICRSCGATMEPDDAFCPACGTHVVDQALIPGDEAALPGGGAPARRAAPRQPDSAYDRPYERLDPSEPDPTFVPPAEGEPIEPLQTFDAPVVQGEEATPEEYDEPSGNGISPVMVGVAALLVAIIIAGIIVAMSGSDGDGATGGGPALGGGSQGGFGSLLPDGTLACAKGTPATAGGARTAVAGAVEIAVPPSTWTSRSVVKGRFQGTGAGMEWALNPGDLDRPEPQSARIHVLSVESDVAYFPDQFLLASLPPGNATTVTQDCRDYGPLTALRVHRVELSNGATLTTRYVVVHDKTRRGSAALFVFEDPRNSGPDAAFFESIVASAKLLR